MKKSNFNKSDNNLIIFHLNIRGFTSKKESLFKTIKNVCPDIVTLNETGMRNRNKVKIDFYISFCKNRQSSIMGEVSTSVKDHLKNHTVNVKEGADNDEWVITRLDHCSPPLCIVNVYGEQEGRTSRDDLLERWTRLRKDLNSIRERGEMCLLLGDLNKHIGSDHLGVAGNHKKVTYGGQLVRELLNTDDYVLVNNLKIAQGGPFTREDPSDPSKKSCLDLAICSKSLEPFIKSLVIDSARNYPIKRVVFRDGKLTSILTDHYPLIVTLHNLPGIRREIQNVTRWNLSRPGAWDTYKSVSDKLSEKIIEVAEDTSKTMDEVVKKVEKIHNDIKYQSFGKTTIKIGNSAKNKQTITNASDDAEILLKDQTEKLEQEINKLKENKQGRAGKVFKIAESIRGFEVQKRDTLNHRLSMTPKQATWWFQIRRSKKYACSIVLMSYKIIKWKKGLRKR